MRPPKTTKAPRRLIVCLVAALLVFYIGLAAYFTYGIITGHSQLDKVFHTHEIIPSSLEEPRASNPLVRPAQLPPTPPPSPDAPKLHPNDDIHIVFSTGCNYFQVRLALLKDR